MAGPDKILEAEQTIQNIAAELKRMRDAASLLQGVQERSDAVLTSAERLTHEVDNFSRRCGDLVTKLEKIDFNQHFSALRSDIERIANLTTNGNKEISETITNLSQFLESLHTKTTQIVSSVKEYGENTANAIAGIESRLSGIEAEAKAARIRQTWTLVVALVVFITASGGILFSILLGR